MLRQSPLSAILLACSVLLGAGCSDSFQLDQQPALPTSAPFQEIIDQGITRYLGRYTPMLSETSGNIVNHTFGAGDGPLCLKGGQYSMATRDLGSSELVIFLQGGGACWPGLCAATEAATKGIPKAGFLDPDQANNPVAAWSMVYLPYCDGGLHASDADSDSDGDGRNDRFQRGLHNLSASLDVAVNTFPSPGRIVLAGSSAGGFGTTFALPLVRHLYPGIPIDVINDSGLGIARPDEPEFIRQRLDDWNISAFLPQSCDTCVGEDGHTTDFLKWQLGQDDNYKLSMMSYKQDAVIAISFTGAGGEVFEQALIPELEDLEAAFPERVHSFVVDGTAHTFLLGDLKTTAGGTAVTDWLSAMLNGSAAWTSFSD